MVHQMSPASPPSVHGRYDDKVGGQCPKKDGFRIVVVTALKPDVYHSKLKKQLPFEHLQPIVIDG